MNDIKYLFVKMELVIIADIVLLMLFCGCKCDIPTKRPYTTPKLVFNTIVSNKSSNQDLNFDYYSTPERAITDWGNSYNISSSLVIYISGEPKNTVPSIECKPGDEVTIHCHQSLDENEYEWCLSKSNTGIVGFDINKTFVGSDSELSFVVPEIGSGKYHFKVSNNYKATTEKLNGYCEGTFESVLFYVVI